MVPVLMTPQLAGRGKVTAAAEPSAEDEVMLLALTAWGSAASVPAEAAVRGSVGEAAELVKGRRSDDREGGYVWQSKKSPTRGM